MRLLSLRPLLAGTILTSLTVAVGTSAAAPPLTLEQTVVQVAAHQIGKPYRMGATGPGAFDCSGLALYSYRVAGRTLPRTALAQYRAIRHIPVSALRPGDLVFMADSGASTDPSRIDHVGIYAGHNSWYVARHTGTTITRQRLWTRNIWAGRP
jgi:cell wall-associated NlpC family hydrolase